MFALVGDFFRHLIEAEGGLGSPDTLFDAAKVTDYVTNKFFPWYFPSSFEVTPEDHVIVLNATLYSRFNVEGRTLESATSGSDYSSRRALFRAHGASTEAIVEELVHRHQHLELLLAELLSSKAYLGWTTHGHTGVDVNLYAYGGDTNRLFPAGRGNWENTQIYNIIKLHLGL